MIACRGVSFFGDSGAKKGQETASRGLRNGGYYDTPHWVLCALCSKSPVMMKRLDIIPLWRYNVKRDIGGDFLAKVKLQVSMDEDLLKRLDDQADDLFLNRSSLVSLAVSEYLNRVEVVSAVKSMAVALRKIADEGCISEESQRQLDDFERISKLLVGV